MTINIIKTDIIRKLRQNRLLKLIITIFLPAVIVMWQPVKIYVYGQSEIKDNDVIIWDYYTLFINYKNYSYKNILSYVFFVEYFVGGAHPNHAIFTVNYDTQKNIFIDVNSIQNIDAISVYARNNLIRDNRIVDTGMLLEGTKPTKENFKNFVFTEDGYIFYFERYQVAPYSSGDISLLIPYDIEKGK